MLKCKKAVRDSHAADVFDVSSPGALAELRTLLLEPISTNRQPPGALANPAHDHRSAAAIVASYKWCCSELVKLARQVDATLKAYLPPVKHASIDIRSNIATIHGIYLATFAVADALAASTHVIATAFSNHCERHDHPQQKFCQEFGSLLTGEWLLMSEVVERIHAGCAVLLNHLVYLTTHAADIGFRDNALASAEAAVDRGLQLNSLRITERVRAQQEVLAVIEHTDKQRRDATKSIR